MWPENFDTDLTDRRDLTVIFKQCWSCFQMFRAKSSAEVRCRKCEKALQNPAETRSVQVRAGSVVRIALPRPAVPIVDKPDIISRDAGKPRIATIRKENPAISINALEAFLDKSDAVWRIRQMGWPWFRAQVRPAYTIAGTEICFRKLVIRRGRKVVHCTKNQWRLLAMLCAGGGDIVPRQILCSQIGAGPHGRSLDTLIAVTRKATRLPIVTVHCIGYRMEGIQ